MLRQNRVLHLLGFITGILILIGCTPATATTVSTAEELPSMSTPESQLLIATATPVVTSTPTSTQVITSTPTMTNTPTFTPSPTPNMVMPGNYYIGRCADGNFPDGVKLKFCINNIKVESNRHMFFDVSWTASNVTDPIGYIIKHSDENNLHIYLKDNLGNRYDHAAGGGAAYRPTMLENEIPHPGWFEFGSPPVEALKFDFHDDDNHLIIKDIVLIPGYGYIQYDTLTLDQYPLIVKYDEDKWDPAKSEENKNMLTHKTIPSCTIQPKSPSVPVGKYKNLLVDGDIEYKIYGNFDDTQGLFIREYVYESGVKGWDPVIRPFFYVTIPADKSLECIVAVNNVLARLAIPKQ
jgi:hypothetical protein